MTIFNAKQDYEEKILPIVNELKKQCELCKIPMFVSCCIENTEKETKYKNDAVCTGSKEIELKDDYLQKYLCVTNGFLVIPPNVKTDLSEEALDYINDIDEL